MLGVNDEELWRELQPWYPSRPRQLTKPRGRHVWTQQPQVARVDVLHTPPPAVTSRPEEQSHPRLILLVVFWLSRIFGVLPFRYDDENEELVVSKWRVAYSVSSILCVLALWSFMTEEVHSGLMQEGNVMSGLEPIMLTVLNVALMALALARSSHLRRIVGLLASLKIELSPRGPGPYTLPCLFPLLMTIVTCSMDSITSLVESTAEDTFLYTPYYWGATGAVLVETQFSAACLALRYWFWLLNQHLAAVRRRAAGAALRLEGLRLTHGYLCAAAVELEAACGPQLLLGCGVCFIGTVLNAYFGVNGFFDSGGNMEASEFMQNTQWLWASLYLIRISTVCFAATRLATEAEHTGRLIHALSDRRLPQEMKEEISYFSMQITTSKIAFTAWGIVTIDFSLLFAIVSSTTTYLLILIQYRPK